MDAVASRDLRNHTADVLRRVGEGGVVAVTVRGEVVAELHPPSDARPRSWRRADMVSWLLAEQADAGLRAELRALTGETTDDLGPLA
jgi:prevent-host-death family protein